MENLPSVISEYIKAKRKLNFQQNLNCTKTRINFVKKRRKIVKNYSKPENENCENFIIGPVNSLCHSEPCGEIYAVQKCSCETLRFKKLSILCQIVSAGFKSLSATKMVTCRKNSLRKNVITRKLLQQVSPYEPVDDVLIAKLESPKLDAKLDAQK